MNAKLKKNIFFVKNQSILYKKIIKQKFKIKYWNQIKIINKQTIFHLTN